MNPLQMALRIKAERKQYEAEEVIHNPDLHQQILEAWRRDSPKMVARLEKQGILDDLAFVCQERMWRAASSLPSNSAKRSKSPACGTRRIRRSVSSIGPNSIAGFRSLRTR